MSASGSSTARSEPARRGLTALGSLTAATAISVAGSALNTIGLLSYVYSRTHDPVPIGIAVLANFLPVACVLPFFGGYLARRSLYRSAVWFAWSQAVVAGGMAVAAATGAPLVVLYVASSALGLLAVAQRVAVLSMLPRLVPREQLSRTNLLVQTSSQVGAALGALALFARGGAPAWFLLTVDASTFVVQGLVLYLMVVDAAVGGPASPPVEVREQQQARLIRRTLPLLPLMPGAFVAMNVLNVAVPLVVLDRVGAGQRGYAAAEAVYPAAGITLTLLLRRWKRLPLPWTLVTIGAGFVLLAVSGSLHLALLAVAVLGAGVALTNAATQALAQSVLEPHELPVVQVRAASLGAAISAGGVVGMTAAFANGGDELAMSLLAAYFALLAGLAVAVNRRWAPGRAGAALHPVAD